LNSIRTLVLDHASSAQVFLFGLVLTGLWVAERIFRPEPTFSKLKHTGFNAAFMLGALPLQLLLISICVAAANWATAHRFGLLYLLPNPENPWLKFGLVFLALDLLDYTYHVISHRVGAIWRLHLVHHSDAAVDVSTTFREHPAETAVRVTFLIGAVLLCGASLQVLILRQTFQTFFNIVQHSRFSLAPLPARIFGLLFVTPNLHHIHHHHRRPGTDCNYGDVFSIWDRLFGTYVSLPSRDVVFGLDSHSEASDTSFLGLLGWNGMRRWWNERVAIRETNLAD